MFNCERHREGNGGLSENRSGFVTGFTGKEDLLWEWGVLGVRGWRAPAGNW